MEVEKLHTVLIDADNASEGGSVIIDSSDAGNRLTEISYGKHHINGPDVPRSGNLKSISMDRKDIRKFASAPVGEYHVESSKDDVSSLFSSFIWNCFTSYIFLYNFRCFILKLEMLLCLDCFIVHCFQAVLTCLTFKKTTLYVILPQFITGTLDNVLL